MTVSSSMIYELTAKKKKNNNFKKDSIENSKYLHGELCDNIK